MPHHLHRGITHPIREHLGWPERWEGPDGGLIYCWERGREMRAENPELAESAARGELMPLAWKGGVEERPDAPAPAKKASKSRPKPKEGTLYYLATWQGLRGECALRHGRSPSSGFDVSDLVALRVESEREAA